MEEDNAATSIMRIFVGGLGESVAAEDLQRLFASLGSVEGVDIIRTKGRSFAYVNFLPSPSEQKSLSKLFNRYNGCLWKGGKLKLEKAKEHYLMLLKREWMEDAELTSGESSTCLDSVRGVSSREIPNGESLKTKQLKIFFPKLKKVKSIPFSGTGKHKYSFQNVEVPALPVHFCDCEEHSSPSRTIRGKKNYDGEAESGGMNDEEINIMKAVMNKLFEREKASNTMHGKTEQDSLESPDNLQSGEYEDSETDDDDLIINIETKKKKTALIGGSQDQELERLLENQESGFVETKILVEQPKKNKLELQERKDICPKKKRVSLVNSERERNDYVSAAPGDNKHKQQTFKDKLGSGGQPTKLGDGYEESTKISWSQKSSWKDLLGERGNNAFNTSHILSDFENQGSDGLYLPNSENNKIEPIERDGDPESALTKTQELQPMRKNEASNQSGRGAAWLQKRSWTQLVRENNNSFSISQILPDSTFKNLKAKEPIKGISNDCKHDGGAKHTNKGHVSDTSDLAKNIPEKNQHVGGNNSVSDPLSERTCTTSEETSIGDVKIGETCSFMRSAASLREWAKTKAAISGSLKRKRSEK
ncbi:hypothetical protein L6164_035327 [Bauhinia variegata]|uniref:Uncharacterized protein n=1 Tax=Bauhinia variegata TaxID=167791 RepID=A0ACB9KDM5_BAUVA|nr:hypothetical protein L6164_035327 [Bauhinia variegata]